MAILPDDDDTEGAGAGASPLGGKTDAKKKHHENLLYIGVALVGVILTFLIWRSNKSSTSSTATTGNPVPSSGLLAGGSSGGTSTDPIAEAGLNTLTGQFQQDQASNASAFAGLQAALSNLTSEVGSMQASPPTQAPAAQSPAATPGYGYINVTGIGQSVILGTVGQGQEFTGYNVAGGAPVYFGNASGAQQGAGAETPGAIAYTPVGYASLVGSTPTTEHLG